MFSYFQLYVFALAKEVLGLYAMVTLDVTLVTVLGGAATWCLAKLFGVDKDWVVKAVIFVLSASLVTTIALVITQT